MDAKRRPGFQTNTLEARSPDFRSLRKVPRLVFFFSFIPDSRASASVRPLFSGVLTDVFGYFDELSVDPGLFE